MFRKASRAARGLRFVVLATTAAAGAPTLAAADARPLNFDQTFSDRGEPSSIHFEALYRAAGASHRLEVWRSGDAQLRRQTDGVIDTYVTHKPRDAEYRMVILDRQRKIATRIDRSNLYRIGNFTDWFDLAHGLRHPKTEYVLQRSAAPAGAVKPVESCNWYQLQSGSQTSEICWSRRVRLPLLIYTGNSTEPVWQISSASTTRSADSVFTIDATGFIENDANQDIDKD